MRSMESRVESFLFKLNECLSPTSLLLVPLYSRSHMCVCVHAWAQLPYLFFFYCNLHLKMMPCKRLSIDSVCYSTLYKISIFSRASIFFAFLFHSAHSSLLLFSLDISKCRPIMFVGILCIACSLKISGNILYLCWNILQGPFRSVHLFIFFLRFVSVDK